jgi:hypothetical protein
MLFFQHVFVILLLSGFMVISLLPNFLGNNDLSFSIVYRAGVLALSLILITISVFRNRVQVKPIGFWIFVFFWFCYSTRIIFDLYVAEIFLFESKTPSDYLQFAFGVVLVPSVALSRIEFRRVNWELVGLWVFGILFASLFAALFFRTTAGITGRSHGNLQIGILQYGQYGASLCLLAIFLLSKRASYGVKSIRFLMYVTAFSLGILTMLVSASKSPFVALVVVTISYWMLKYGKIKSLIVTFLFSAIAYFTIFDVLKYLEDKLNTSFLYRLQYTLEGGDTVRSQLLQIALESFVDNPVYGHAMLIQESPFIGSYPHNMLGEALMATGVFGGLAFLSYVVIALRSWSTLIKIDFCSSWLGMLFLQFTLFGMFSGNLFSSSMFWYMSILVIFHAAHVKPTK